MTTDYIITKNEAAPVNKFVATSKSGSVKSYKTLNAAIAGCHKWGSYKADKNNAKYGFLVEGYTATIDNQTGE